MKKWLFLPLLAIILALGVSFFDGSGVQGAVNVTALVPEVATSTTIAVATGGDFTFVNTNNTTTTLSFPQDYYTESLTLQAYAYPANSFASTKPAPSSEGFVGKNYDFNLYDGAGDKVSTVSEPVTITLTYKDDDFIGFDENTILPYRWGTGDSAWHLISGSVLDTVDNKVTFSTAAFGSFALFASPPETPGGGGNNGGNTGGTSGGSVGVPSSGGGLAGSAGSPSPALSKTLADLNNDGRIDVADLSILLFYYGKSGGDINSYDFDKDGIIDLKDISILLYYWHE